MDKIRKKRLIKRCIIMTVIIGFALPSCISIGKNIFDYYKNQMLNAFVPDQATCDIQHISSCKIKEGIELFVKGHTTKKSLLNFNPKEFYAQFKEQFPIVKSCQWALVPPKTLQLTIIGQKPYCLVNNQWVMGEHDELFEKDDFFDEKEKQLPNIWIDDVWINDKLDAGVATFVHTIPHYLLDNNMIIYHAPWHIDIIPHQSICNCRIITDEKNFFAQSKFDAISPIFQNLCHKRLITLKTLQSKGTPIAFDLRVKNQVIVKFLEPSKRGRGL